MYASTYTGHALTKKHVSEFWHTAGEPSHRIDNLVHVKTCPLIFNARVQKYLPPSW